MLVVLEQFGSTGHDVAVSVGLPRKFGECATTVLSWILEQISPEWIVKAISEIREARTKDTGANHDGLAGLRKEDARLKREIDRLVAALAASEDSPEAMMKHSCVALHSSKNVSVRDAWRNSGVLVDSHDLCAHRWLR